jgi:hypothetical protein
MNRLEKLTFFFPNSIARSPCRHLKEHSFEEAANHAFRLVCEPMALHWSSISLRSAIFLKIAEFLSFPFEKKIEKN